MLTASCVGVVVGYAGVRRIGDLFEEFVVFQHALVNERKALSLLSEAVETIISE